MRFARAVGPGSAAGRTLGGKAELVTTNNKSYDVADIVTEFTVEKNGMRFPGRVEIVKSRYKIFKGKRGAKAIERDLFRVTQAYTSYRFFGVRARDRVRDIVAGTVPEGGTR